MVEQLKLIGDQTAPLLMLDKELSTRQAPPPSGEGET
jgi:hypothetical protein